MGILLAPAEGFSILTFLFPFFFYNLVNGSNQSNFERKEEEQIWEKKIRKRCIFLLCNFKDYLCLTKVYIQQCFKIQVRGVP